MLVLDALALETGELAEPQVEDRLRLDLGELEARHELLARGVRVLGVADERDDLVEVVEGDEVALEHVRALERLAQLVLRPAGDDLALVVEVVPDELEQRQRARDAVDERDGVVAEGRLQLGVLEELVEDDLWDRLALEIDLDPHARAVRMVLHVGDLAQHLLVDEVGDLLDDARITALLHAVRQLRDDDGVLAAAELLDVSARAHDDPPAARAIRVAHT